ncbi:MAG TPA: hypothetical protein VKH37_13690, partial [Ferruginibacter sp.]|nr:hypothetical protein [Ferruginibacter sp.]
MRYQSYLNTATKIIGSYDGAMPLSHFLKQFFAKEKKYGSKDRKQISSLCYNFYRLGKVATGLSVEERIIVASFLCEQGSNEFISFHRPAWNQFITSPLEEKCSICNLPYPLNIFPWNNELTAGIDAEKFSASFLQQPDLFLRIRPGKEATVRAKLQAASVNFQMMHDDCMALPNATKIDQLLDIDKDVVIQDASSQRVLDHLNGSRNEPIPIWDCCAASGGKSLLAYD